MQAQTLEKFHFPAPTGGVNSVDSASELPPADCVYAYNLVRAQLGLRSRTGYQEWQVGLKGGTDSTVRTTMPYSGSVGAKDRLFEVTAQGIWDCTAKGGMPTLVQAFTLLNDPAGYGVFTVTSTPAGRFLVFVDEVNGPFLYTESTGLWAPYASGVAAPWQTNLFVVVGTEVTNGGNTYKCTTGGTTNGSGSGPAGTGPGITDGATVVWTGTAGVVANAVGPSVADQNNGLFSGGAALPPSFAAVTIWKSRLWFIERGATRGWYLAVNSIFGQATSFDFGFKMKTGGPLVQLYNWSFDGGSGPDARLVAISTAGDVVIYQGTDPSSANTFGLVGTWSVGGVPAGRRIAVEYGGDILVASMLGLVPLSKLIIGNPTVDRTVYDTYKVSNLFNQLAVTFQSLLGWAVIIHPTDNCILVNIPQPLGWQPLQFAMAFSTRSWSVYRGLPIVSAQAWNGLLYVGTADGRVCVCQGAVDNVTLSNPAANQLPVSWSLLTSFRGSDKPTKKVVRQIRPLVLSAVPNPVLQAVAKLDFDTSEPADASASGAGGPGTWDTAIWDQSRWGNDFTPANPVIGAYGVANVAVAVAVRGQAISYTTFVGADVSYEDASFV